MGHRQNTFNKFNEVVVEKTFNVGPVQLRSINVL